MGAHNLTNIFNAMVVAQTTSSVQFS